MTIDEVAAAGRGADAALLEALRSGFGGRPAIPMAELSKLLKLDEKTLLRHVRNGSLPFRALGSGRRRIARRFTIADVVHFLENRQNGSAAVPSATKMKARQRGGGGGFTDMVLRPRGPKSGGTKQGGAEA